MRLGVRGIARDLAARGLGTLKPLEIPAIKGSFPSPIGVNIDPALKAKGCPLFAGPPDPGRHERRLARLAAGPAEGHRPAPDLGAGRYHQLSSPSA